MTTNPPIINRIISGISIRGIKPEMAIAHTVVTSVFTAWRYGTAITSGTSGKHGRASLHYVGYALDYRTRHIKERVANDYDREHSEDANLETDTYYQLREEAVDLVLKLITAQIDDALGSDFDVVLESTHIHVEFQPKGAMNVSI